MNRLWKLVGGLLGVVLVGIALWWGGSRRAQPGSQPSGDTFETPPVPTAQTPAKTGNSSFFRRLSKNRAIASLTNEGALSATSTNLIVQWEARVDGVLTSDGKEADKAKQMLELLPRLPEDGQVEVAHHISNLLPDQDYASLENLLTNATLPEPVLDVLLADTLNRPNSLKLPTLLDVARDPKNPKAGEAKELLTVFLEQDYGTDWNLWQSKIVVWLKNNPD